MEALALIRSTGKVPIHRLIEQEKERLSRNSIVVVITSSASSEMAGSLIRLNNRGATVIAVLLAPASFGGIANSSDITRHLTTSGIPVYTVNRGDDLATAHAPPPHDSGNGDGTCR